MKLPVQRFWMNTKVRHSGTSFIGMMVAGVIIFSLILVATKMVPAYIEYGAVKKRMSKIGHEPSFSTMTNQEIAKMFDTGANISYITSVKSSDLTIDETDQKIVASDYQVVKPLLANISLMMKFKATTKH